MFCLHIYYIYFMLLFFSGPSWKQPLGDWRSPLKILTYYHHFYQEEDEKRSTYSTFFSKVLRPSSDAVLHMSRVECQWGRTKDFSHLYSIRLKWSEASELGLRNVVASINLTDRNINAFGTKVVDGLEELTMILMHDTRQLLLKTTYFKVVLRPNEQFILFSLDFKTMLNKH